ncbi:MAG TPA: SCP2 sterol-binding domain-containing protein [Acidimicrobiales bacterium]|nr:SCP2 sterol-binding domain-containing protein [Acidimicrobiales bacterium]
MPDFLSPGWFSDLNAALAAVEPPDGELRRVVVEFLSAPSGVAHAMTFSVGPAGCGVALGDHLGADALLRIDYADARAIAEGRLTSADALREGRVKVRGDVDVFQSLLEWLLGLRAR